MNQILKGLVTLLVTMVLVGAMTKVSPLRVVAAISPSNNNVTANHTKANTSPAINASQKSIQTKISVVASFFPIYEFVKAVGGNRIDASALIPIGAEPHNFDPTIQEIQKANSANLLVDNGGSMEEPWIHNLTPQNTVDTSKGIKLLANPSDPDIKGPNDPHIWLDPILAIHQVQNIRDGLDKVDPKNTAYYNQNAQNFIGQLNKLDMAFKGNLTSSNCAKRDFISFHLAFGYFAPHYGLTQHPVHQGLTPSGEVLPQKLIEVVNLAKNLGLKVIYNEDLLDPRSAQTIAEQIPGTKVMVLSPVERINGTEQNAGIGYIDKMYQDLSALKVGLQCKT